MMYHYCIPNFDEMHEAFPNMLYGEDTGEEIVGAKKVVIVDAAHHLHMEKPQEFNQVVLNFLESL